MYLSRVEIDMVRRSTMVALVSPQKFHGAIESCFTGERRRHLWRIDKLGQRTYILILSEEKPDLSGMVSQYGTGESPETRDYDTLLNRIVTGSVWRFRLIANPTESLKKSNDPTARGEVIACSDIYRQKQWMMKHAEKNGFILPYDFAVTSSQWYQFKKGGKRPVSILAVTYEGILKVTDKDLFCKTLCSGIGRGKAYGLGLLTVMNAGGRNG